MNLLLFALADDQLLDHVYVLKIFRADLFVTDLHAKSFFEEGYEAENTQRVDHSVFDQRFVIANLCDAFGCGQFFGHELAHLIFYVGHFFRRHLLLAPIGINKLQNFFRFHLPPIRQEAGCRALNSLDLFFRWTSWAGSREIRSTPESCIWEYACRSAAARLPP